MGMITPQQQLIDLLRYQRVITIRVDQDQIHDYFAEYDNSQSVANTADQAHHMELATEIANHIYYDIHEQLLQHNLGITSIDEWFEQFVVDQVPQIVIDDRILIRVEYD